MEESIQSEHGLVSITAKNTIFDRFRDYLVRRGFAPEHHANMADLYGLQCAVAGKFKCRIVFPVNAIGVGVVGYSARAVDNGKLRYLSHPGSIVKRHVLWEHLLVHGGRELFVCEGPFDALKIDYVCRRIGSRSRACCTFGTAVTRAQINRIAYLAQNFVNVSVLFDDDVPSQMLNVQSELISSGVRSRIARMPDDVHDPGDLDWAGVSEFIKSRDA